MLPHTTLILPPSISQTSDSYSRIVNRHHFDRLSTMLAGGGGQVLAGGRSDAADLFIEPTLILSPAPESTLMTHEIFGEGGLNVSLVREA